MGALINLARAAAARILSTGLGGPGRRALVGGAAGASVLGLGIPGVDLFPGGGGGARPRRRRRRPMFTSTDLAQLAAAEALAGKPAVKSLMMILAAKA